MLPPLRAILSAGALATLVGAAAGVVGTYAESLPILAAAGLAAGTLAAVLAHHGGAKRLRDSLAATVPAAPIAAAVITLIVGDGYIGRSAIFMLLWVSGSVLSVFAATMVWWVLVSSPPAQR